MDTDELMRFIMGNVTDEDLEKATRNAIDARLYANEQQRELEAYGEPEPLNRDWVEREIAARFTHDMAELAYAGLKQTAIQLEVLKRKREARNGERS